jgi:hypothetical protein
MQLVQSGLADVVACNSLTEWERPNIVARALFKVNAHIVGAFCDPAQVGSAPDSHFTPNDNIQIGWTSPVTSKLLLEAAVGFVPSHWPNSLPVGVLTNASITELSTGFVDKKPAVFHPKQDANRYNQRFWAAYMPSASS